MILEPSRRIRIAGLAVRSPLSVTGNACSSGELGLRDLAPHELGATLVYRLSSSGRKSPGILPRV